jgi:hypothetical protein
MLLELLSMVTGAVHVARIREMRNAYKIILAKLEGMRPLGISKVDGRITLKRTGC